MMNATVNIYTKDDFLDLYQPIHEVFIRYCSSKAFGLMSAEDLAQESILATLGAFERIQNKANLLGYMIGVVNNIIKNQLRRKKFQGIWDEQAFAKVAAQVKDPAIALDIQYLHQCIQKLRPKYQQAIILFELGGLSINEVSKIEEISPEAFKTRLHRARKALREQLAGELNEAALSARLSIFASILF